MAFYVRLATRLGERLVGLLRKDVCTEGEVMLLCPCSSIHTFGMKGNIDVAFIDSSGYVAKVIRNLPPGRFYSCHDTSVVLERRSGDDSIWFEAGDVVRLTVATQETGGK